MNDVFFLSCSLLCQKKFFWSLSNVSQCFSYHVFIQPLDQKNYKIQNIFKPGAHNIPHVLVPSNVPSTFNITIPPPLVPKEKNHVQPNTPNISNMFFNTSLWFIVILVFLVGILVLLSFPIFFHHRHCPYMLLLFTKCRSSPNENGPSNLNFY